MVIPSNPRQLLLAKELSDEANTLAKAEDSLSLLKAVLLLDLAVETMLNVLITDLAPDAGSDEAGRKDTNWHTLWRTTVDAMKSIGSRPANFRQLAALHEVRNLAQHNGTIPDRSDVQRYIEPVRQTLRRAAKDAYGIELDNFRMWDLVPNEKLRVLLVDAEEALSQGKVERAIIGAKLAHKQILGAVGSQRSGNHSYLAWVGDRAPSDDAYEGLSQRIVSLEDKLAAIGVGMPIRDVLRFAQAGAGVAVMFTRGGWYAETVMGRVTFDANNATFMLDYISRLLRLLYENYPGLIDSIEVRGSLRDLDS